MTKRQLVAVHKTEASSLMTMGGATPSAATCICDQSAFLTSVQPPRSMSTQVRHIYERPRLSSSGQAHCKRLLYGTLAKHYGHTDRPPLLPQHMADVYTAITDLLGKSPPCVAIRRRPAVRKL